MILLTLTLGSRNYFSWRALVPENHLLRQKILRISLNIFSRPLCSSPLQFTATDISLWISACTCYSHDHFSSLLLLQDTSNYSPLSRESFEFTVLRFYFTWKPLWFFPHIYREFVILNCSCVSQNSSEYYSIFQKSSAACYSWNSCLLALWLIPYD